MSSSAPSGSGPPGDKPQGFSKFIRRASKVLKRGSSNKYAIPGATEETPSSSRSPVPAGSSSAPLSSSVAPTASAVPTKAAPKTVPSVQAAIQQSIKDTKPSTKNTNPRLAATAAASSALQEEKARALFAKYGLTLEPGEWKTPTRGDVERVEKKVRMRVHRTCHRCSTNFGAEKVCVSCHHTRCKKCPRYPTKKPKDSQAKGKGLATGIATDDGAKGKSAAFNAPLTMPHRVTGKELTRRAPVQRVRRTCHKCDILFVGKNSPCESCNHLRCPKCPREPAKLSKYPDGYPGDTEEAYPLASRELRPTRTHVRWTCHSCSTVFKDQEKTCRNCAHQRCNACPREPPKIEPEPLDEAAIQRVTEKMKNIEIAPQASAA